MTIIKKDITKTKFFENLEEDSYFIVMGDSSNTLFQKKSNSNNNTLDVFDGNYLHTGLHFLVYEVEIDYLILKVL